MTAASRAPVSVDLRLGCVAATHLAVAMARGLTVRRANPPLIVPSHDEVGLGIARQFPLGPYRWNGTTDDAHRPDRGPPGWATATATGGIIGFRLI